MTGKKKCTSCRQMLPLTEFEPHGSGLRAACRKCRAGEWTRRRRDTRAANRLPEQHEPTPEQRVAIINAFALWFGPVDRSRPLVPEVNPPQVEALNIITEGVEAAAERVKRRVDMKGGSHIVFVRPSGTLAVYATGDRRIEGKPSEDLVGIYRNGATLDDIAGDLEERRKEIAR